MLIENIANLYTELICNLKSLIRKIFKEEDINGESCKSDTLLYINAANNLAALIQYSIDNGCIKSWQQLEDDFELDKLRKCFMCVDINLNGILDMYGITEGIAACGINHVGHQITNIVGLDENCPCSDCNEDTPIATYNPKELKDECINYVKQC